MSPWGPEGLPEAWEVRAGGQKSFQSRKRSPFPVFSRGRAVPVLVSFWEGVVGLQLSPEGFKPELCSSGEKAHLGLQSSTD